MGEEEEPRVEEWSLRWAEAEELEVELRQQEEGVCRLELEMLQEVAAAESSAGCYCWRRCCYSPFLAAAVDCC
jgi:hypothetical protein